MMKEQEFNHVFTSKSIIIPDLNPELFLQQKSKAFSFIHQYMFDDKESFTPSNKLVPGTRKRIQVFNRKSGQSGTNMLSFIKEQNGLFPNLSGILMAYPIIREKVFRSAFKDKYNLEHGINLMAPDEYAEGRSWVASMQFMYGKKPSLYPQDWINVRLIPAYNYYFFFLCD